MAGFLRAAGAGKLHPEARSLFTHWEQYGFCRSHFSLAWRQFVQLSWVRFLLWSDGFIPSEGPSLRDPRTSKEAGAYVVTSIVEVLKHWNG